MKNNICTHIPTFHLKTVRLIFSCTLGRRSWPYDLHSIKSSRESEWGEQGWFCREVTSTTSTRDIKIFSTSWKTKQQNNETLNAHRKIAYCVCLWASAGYVYLTNCFSSSSSGLDTSSSLYASSSSDSVSCNTYRNREFKYSSLSRSYLPLATILLVKLLRVFFSIDFFLYWTVWRR